MSCGPDGRGVGVEGVDVDSFFGSGGLSPSDLGLTSIEGEQMVDVTYE